MTAYIALAVGSFFMACGAVLMVWPRLRVLRLKNDLLELRIRALEAASGEPDPAHAFVDRHIAAVIEVADLLTTTGYAVSCMTHSGEEASSELQTECEESRIAKWLLQRAGERTFRYLLSETFSGMLFTIMCTTLIGWKRFSEPASKSPATFVTITASRHCAVP